MLEIRRQRLAKPVAFLIALLMILLYTVAVVPVSYAASGTPVKVHLKGELKEEINNIECIKAKIGDDVATLTERKGKHFEGNFDKKYSDTSRTLVTEVIIVWKSESSKEDTIFASDQFTQSAVGKGNGNLNVFLRGNSGSEPAMGIIEISKIVQTSEGAIVAEDSTKFNFTISGSTEYEFEENFTLENGESIEYDLPYGNYTVTETVHEGYDQETESIDLTINNAETISHTFINVLKSNGEDPSTPKGTITISKTVDTGDPMVSTYGNTTMTVSDPTKFSFTIVGDDFSKGFELADGEDMTFTLPYGTYTVTEKEHEDYDADNSSVTLTLNSDNDEVSYEFVNRPKQETPPTEQYGSVTICKVVVENGGGNEEPGPRAFVVEPQFRFTIVDATGADAAEPFNLGGGECKTLDLPYGAYTVIEEKHDDYVADESNIDFTIDEQNKSGTYHFVNRRVSEEEPPAEYGFDLAVIKTVDKASVYVGAEVTFTVKVTYYGEENAPSVIVSDLLPTGLTFVSANATNGEYDKESGNWRLDGIGGEWGESATLTIVAKASVTGTYVNTATLLFQGDDNPKNDSDSASVNVRTRSGGGSNPGSGDRDTRPPVDDDSGVAGDYDEENDADDSGVAGDTDIVDGENPVLETAVVTGNSDMPKTGDEANIALLFSLMIASFVGISILARRKEGAK